jgi:peptide/nickel transport system ATP-binding protein
MNENLLQVEELQVEFTKDNERVRILHGVSFQIQKGEILGLVGESGCGKSLTSLSLMRLFKGTSGQISGGRIVFNGQELSGIAESEMRKIRGKRMAMIFQEPMTSLNPVMKIGEQLMEPIRLHLGWKDRRAREHAIHMLNLVGIPRASEVLNEYPHQLSGGMRQRVMIAMAMSCHPQLLIADEPTTALVTIQAQILELIKKLQRQENLSVLLITHDLGVVAEMCDRVVVMYAGRVVEEADVFDLFEDPKHPYTRGLIQSVPKLGQNEGRLASIKGNVPDPSLKLKGCAFASRCSEAMPHCFEEEPVLKQLTSTRACRCWLHEERRVRNE